MVGTISNVLAVILHVIVASLQVVSTMPLNSIDHDVIVYDTTPSGVMAAVAAGRLGCKVLLVAPTKHVGGVCSGGLGQSDVGSHTELIGGLALEFFNRSASTYVTPPVRSPWNLEPHIARQVFLDMLAEANVVVVYNAPIDNVLWSSDENSAPRLRAIVTAKETYHGSYFIDASYEGDLLGLAGVSHSIGRESVAAYNETFAGNLGAADGHEFDAAVSPLDRDTGLPLRTRLLTTSPPGAVGQGDGKVESYNFRLCVTQNTSNMVPFTKPRDYNGDEWEIARRWIIATNGTSKYLKAPSCNTAPVPNGKYDMNNCGPISTDFIGWSWNWTKATRDDRQRLWDEHKSYTQGLLWFLSTDDVVPQHIRDDMGTWGLCADEFVEYDNWPPQLYVREGRRMIGDTVFTQNDIERQQRLRSQGAQGVSSSIGAQGVSSSIGMGAYNYDSHNAQRYSCTDPTICTKYKQPYVWNEGDLERPPGEYQIPAQVLMPQRKQVANLVVSVAVAASHVAFATLRMEPQFMIMGQAAGVVAALSMTEGHAVQSVDMSLLQSTLLSQGAVLSSPAVE